MRHKLRDNQIEAFKKLDNNGLETGIHCQATGCGKSYIIIKYIHYTNKIINNPKIILFTERVNILSDLFSFKKNSIKVDNKKLEHWKNIGIGDLTNFNIINRVTIKKNDWIELLKESNKPTLLVINRAYLTLGKLYNKLDNNDLHLILHDECHNTSSIQCHDLLLKCHSLNIPIIGFSATPLRTGNDDKIKLLEIYSKVNNKNELNLLTDYNMIYAIDKELILPPEFYWYQIESYNKKKDNIISQEDLGSVLEILNHIIPLLPNKKIIAWCGTINRAKNWKTLFESNYKQRKNLKNFKFGIDTSESNTNDYDNFSKESNNHEMYNGYSILFCASKHREGSDIPLLDCCIFLDEVKNRGAIPFIQSIGRVLRTSENKTKGIIIDGIVKDNNNYDKEFVDKIIGYYMALENLTTNDKTKYEQYIELKDIVQFDKEKEIINGHYSQTLASLTGLRVGLTRGEAIDVIRLYFAPKSGDDIVSTAQAEFKQNDDNILLFSAADKSKIPVSAEEIFISFKIVDDLELVNDFGLRKGKVLAKPVNHLIQYHINFLKVLELQKQ